MNDMERISVLLQKQKELEKEQHEEFERIADECEREGYPSHGSNYSLRVEQINREYYQPEFDRIADELEAAGYIPTNTEIKVDTTYNLTFL